MGKITINELSDSLKDHIDGKQDATDNLLETNNKTIVGAINELFQSADNGKELIADAIGEPLSAEDTFQAMSDDINELLEYFRYKLISIGVTDSLDNLKLKGLIDKIKGPTKYSITKNLTNCTINNAATIVEEDSSYKAAITANSNYIMKSITVTMGGMDLTSNVVANYNINIPYVIGDIVISAEAVANNPYEPGTNVNNTITSFSAYQYNPVTKSIPVEADGNYTLSFDYGPNISNQGYTASVTVNIYDANNSRVDGYSESTTFSGWFSKDLTLKKGYSISITASISPTTHSSHCNQVRSIKLTFNSI